MNPEKINDIFKEIMRERIRQNEKWGEQNHPMRSETADIYDDYRKKANTAKFLYEYAEKRNEMTWKHIIDEEIAEAFAESEPEKQREEMIQAAAVAVQIIEYLDRQMKKEQGNGKMSKMR